MASNPVWKICERMAEVQALLHDHAECGKHKLPSVPRQMLKDIPRPPNSASRDD